MTKGSQRQLPNFILLPLRKCLVLDVRLLISQIPTLLPPPLISLEHKHLLKTAQLELKKSKRKDYYKVLGVGKQATEDEIKKAYRKRALMHHPGNEDIDYKKL